jgi:hypothetical protein
MTVQGIEMRMWRSHPVRFAALIGALAGFANAILIEFGGALNKNSTATLLFLLPNVRVVSGITEARATQTALLLFIEFGVNILVYAFLFAAPVALIVAIRRAFASRKDRLQ